MTNNRRSQQVKLERRRDVKRSSMRCWHDSSVQRSGEMFRQNSVFSQCFSSAIDHEALFARNQKCWQHSYQQQKAQLDGSDFDSFRLFASSTQIGLLTLSSPHSRFPRRCGKQINNDFSLCSECLHSTSRYIFIVDQTEQGRDGKCVPIMCSLIAEDRVSPMRQQGIFPICYAVPPHHRRSGTFSGKIDTFKSRFPCCQHHYLLVCPNFEDNQTRNPGKQIRIRIQNPLELRQNSKVSDSALNWKHNL